MKTRTNPSLAARHRQSTPRRGVALVLVLGCLILLTTLILALLITGQSNLKSSKLYANGSSVKTLADSTVSLVMAQIQQATSNGTTVAWASQPGMIRTYPNYANGTSSASQMNYRLYSWDSPTVSGPYTPSTDESQLSSSAATPWYSSPSVFVDLNKPVADSTGTLHYPIIDGNPSDLTAPPSNSTEVFPSNTWSYMSGTSPLIEGFWVNQQNTTSGPAVSTSSTTTPNNIPMPVKWLYVLKNGTVVAPASGSSGTTVTISAASSSNPIVGRIAYWTDDETSKVNINTASEGVFWDTPRADTTFEENNLAEDQPAQNEFQRYPGHPATTCLSTVLGSILNTSASNPPATLHTGMTSPYYVPSQFMPYYALAPKLNVGSTSQTANLGSNAGTAPPVTNVNTKNVAGAGALSYKADRLYNSVDELVFESGLANGLTPTTLPGATGVTASSTYQRTTSNNGVNSTIASNNTLSNQFLEKARFFLTASSRAPDVNLFNQPRIGLWPVNATNITTYRTTLDNTIAFCGTINNYPYYFQRNNSFSPTNDLPTTATANGVGRNWSLYSYLQNLTNTPVPGFGGTFVTKYTQSECNQILTEIFDYIRCENLEDPNLTAAGQFSVVFPNASHYVINPNSYTTNCGIGQVVPIQVTDPVFNTTSRGFGRFPTITEADLMFIVEGWNDNSAGSPSTSDPNYTSLSGTLPWGYYGGPTGGPVPNCWDFTSNGVLSQTPIAPGHVRVQAALILSLFDPSQGYPPENGCYQISAKGMDSWTWNGGANMGFPAAPPGNALTNWPVASGTVYGYNQEKWGGVMDFRTMVAQMSPTQAKNTFKWYPFFSYSIDIPYTPSSAASSTNPTPITFSGGTITLSMYVPTGLTWTPGTLLQTIKLTFPSGSFPCPVYAGPVTDSNGTYDMARWDERFAQGTNPWSPQTFLVTTKDVVRSVRLNTDARLVAAAQSIDASTSGVNASYFTSYLGTETTNLMHNLWLSIGMPLYGAIWGQQVPGLTYSAYSNPWNGNAGNMGTLLSAGYCPTQGAFLYNNTNPPTPTTNLGDWDNGVGVAGDGPYINKADEGDFQYWNTSGAGTATIPYFTDWYSDQNLANPGQTFFSPNRLMPSPVMFGSLSTGVIRGLPWQTLLFNPNPAGGNTHPGFGVGASGTPGPSDVPPYTKPPDHLLLDLFNMPVVEPYPISEPLSTAGRINMNYQIVPFTYIERSTGVRAVLKSERMTVIPDTDVTAYKNLSGTSVSFTSNNYRVPINLDATLSEFDTYFATNDIFRSASQICNIPFVPSVDANGTAVSLPFIPSTFWSTHRLTGINSRDRPYATIYPRLTTKSNTFTVHYYVQTLQKVTGSAPTLWNENSDVVTGEYRGSTTIERYVNPNDTTLPDFTTGTAAITASQTGTALDQWYKFRVVSTKQFAP